MKGSFILSDILKYGPNWLIVFIPSIIAFLIIGPLNDIPEWFHYGHEIGFVAATISLSVSAAGIFHFLVVFRPNRIKSKKTFEIIKAHIDFIDKIIIELVKIIDPSIDQLETLEENLGSFAKKLTEFNFSKMVVWNSPTIGIQIGSYNKLFSSALVRFENIKDAMAFSPIVFDASDFEKISDSIFYRDFIAKEELPEDTYQRSFLNILEFYYKLSKNLKEKIREF